MRELIALAACCGCNSFYGLDRTQLQDAPGPDAPAKCPDDGKAPMFPLSFRQAIEQPCSSFMLGDVPGDPTKRYAMAYCQLSGLQLASGPLTGPLEVVTIDYEPPQFHQLRQHVLVPEGDELWINVAQTTSGFLAAFRFNGQAWTHDRDLPIPIDPNGLLGIPSRGPDRRIAIQIGQTVVEYAEDGREVGRWDAAAFEVNQIIDRASHSEDGHRIVFVASRGIGQARPFHAYRVDRDGNFGRAEPLIEVDPVTDAYLTSDCARLYFSALNTVMFAQLQ